MKIKVSEKRKEWLSKNSEKLKGYCKKCYKKRSAPKLALSRAKRELKEYYQELKEKEKESAEIKREFRNLSIYILAILGFSRNEIATFAGLHLSRISFIIHKVEGISGWKS